MPTRESLSEVRVIECEGQRKRTILFVSQDVGSGNALAPIVKELGELNPVIYASGLSRTSWRDTGSRSDWVDPLLAIEHFQPKLIITGVSQSGSSLERYFTRAAKKRGIPVMWIMDSFGGSMAKHLKSPHGITVESDFYCVMDSVAKEILFRARPETNPDHIFVTGQPAFDRLLPLAVDKENIRRKLRSNWQTGETERVVLFAGQLAGTKETLISLINELNLLPNISLIFRPHPRDQALGEYPSVLSSFRGKVIDTSDSKNLESDVLPGCDLALSMFSTVLLSAIHLRIAAGYLLYEPQVMGMAIKDLQTNRIPPVELGAAAGVFERSRLRQTLENLLDNPEYLKQQTENQKQNYPLDGKNAHRVAEVIRLILGQKR